MTEQTHFAYALGGQPCSREQFYAVACDPQRNVVVQACAGAGKTWMLVSRILRALLLQSTQDTALKPQEILAITFTKKAAGEMRQRLQEWLEDFASADEATLMNELRARGVLHNADAHTNDKNCIPRNSIDAFKLSKLQQMLLQSSRSVQIRTFHSWFAALLRSAPLAVLEQLGLPAQYELLEDDSQAVAQVWRRFYAVLHGDDALRHIYNDAVAAHGRFNVDKALSSALDKRVEFALADAAGVVNASIRPFAQVYAEFAGLDAPLELLAAGRVERQQLVEAGRILGRYDGKIPQKAASEIERAITDNDLPAALSALVTKEGTARKFSDKVTGIEHVRALQEQCIRINAAQQQHGAWQHQQRMAQLSRALIASYSALKRERAWVDMGDVERAALHLLSDPVLSGWVLERLDAQTRHLLIDEFQDTNPLQWQALQAWLSGYAGAGSSAPSVFIVGDPKQSIYRFRRAEPQVFIAATDFVCEALGGVVLSCDHTRRNARGVLAAVNGVMQGAADQGYEGFRPHTTESAVAGSVLRLPLVAREAADDEDANTDWRDTLTTPRDEATEHIRSRECAQAALWVQQHIASGTPAGQVMVLARKRDRLQRMALALQERGIASQISEKTPLFSYCEVQDVVALVDALVSTTHDLSLARALKSPLFGWTDAQLVTVAQAAKALRCTWWQVITTLLSNKEQESEYFNKDEAVFINTTAATLQQYQQWFATLPPHDALAAVYHHANVLARCMAAAPAAQRDATAHHLQALLAAALDVDGGRFLTPYAWVRALKAASVRAPTATALQADAVQLLTVHGAKGLEAHTVLMLDTNAQAEKARSMDVLIDWPAQHSAPTTFAFLATESAAPQCVAAALLHEQTARAREETNALYVAMTRAQHTLALSAHEVAKPDAHSPWQRFAALGEDLVGSAVVGWQDDDSDSQTKTQFPHNIPAQFTLLTMPPLQVNTVSSGTKTALHKPLIAEQGSAEARIGQCMHRLLELYAPGYDLAAAAPSVATQFALNAEQSAQALTMAQAITQGPAAWLWDAALIDWQANEVELVHAGQSLRIDRLVKQRDNQHWWVIDYKSAAAAHQHSAHREQLATYQQAVQTVYPTSIVRAALISGTGQLTEL
jgi:ATP-dependent helicase/nuclease subunit A